MRNELNAIIIEKYRPDYQNAARKEKSKILDELVRLTELERKHIIKLLSSKKRVEPAKPVGRPKDYSEAASEHIIELHSLMEQISPKRMKQAIPLWLPFYEKHYGRLADDLRQHFLRSAVLLLAVF